MKTGYVFINDQVFEAAIAQTEAEQMKGLMFQEKPEPMAFVYAQPRINKFWMKNTPAELDIVFAANGKVSQIKKGEPYSLAPIGDNSPSSLVVEFPFGTASRMNIKIGDTIGILDKKDR
jgi:uncharacterized protein